MKRSKTMKKFAVTLNGLLLVMMLAVAPLTTAQNALQPKPKHSRQRKRPRMH